MGVASLILGIISLVIGFIPFCGIIALVPAIVGLILGIVEIAKKGKAGEPKGKGIAGLVCSAIAIVIIIAYYVLAGIAARKVVKDTDWNALQSDLSSSFQDIEWTIDEE